MDGRWSIPARDWQADVAQEKLNRAFGLGRPVLVAGIDGGDGDAEFLAPPLDDLSVARVMEEMAAASWFTVRLRARKVDGRVVGGEEAEHVAIGADSLALFGVVIGVALEVVELRAFILAFKPFRLERKDDALPLAHVVGRLAVEAAGGADAAGLAQHGVSGLRIGQVIMRREPQRRARARRTAEGGDALGINVKPGRVGARCGAGSQLEHRGRFA